MQPDSSQRETILVTGLSNQEFLARYAAPGRLGLSGGITLIDKAICRAQRHLDDDEEWGSWSHAFLFQGERADGHHWVIESDLQLHHKHIQFGAQENRISKYYDEKLYTSLAVLDFGLSPAQCAALVKEGLELVANRTLYSVRELVGTLIALRHSELRARTNLLARQRSMYCSALVNHVFRQAGLDWQIWIQRGDQALPRKLILTTTDDPRAPPEPDNVSPPVDGGGGSNPKRRVLKVNSPRNVRGSLSTKNRR
jgi:hypothetical protein